MVDRTRSTTLLSLALLLIMALVSWFILSSNPAEPAGISLLENDQSTETVDDTEKAKGKFGKPHNPRPQPPLRKAAPASYSLQGQVTDLSHRPLSGAMITAFWRLTGEPGRAQPLLEINLAPTKSDPQGGYHFDLVPLTTLSSLTRAAGELSIQAFHPGHIPAIRRIQIPPDWGTDHQALRVDLQLKRGGLLQGRVVNNLGKGTPGIKVDLGLYIFGKTTEEEDLTNVATTTTDGQGFYYFAIPRNGYFKVYASGGNQGWCKSAGISLFREQGFTLPDLLLGGRGTGEIAGRVVTPLGTPVAGVSLKAWQHRCPVENSGPGLTRAMTMTDAQGVFHFTGLQPGSYRISYISANQTYGPKISRLDEGRFATGNRALEFVFTSTRIHLQVRDSQGRPLPGALINWRAWRVPTGMSLAQVQKERSPTWWTSPPVRSPSQDGSLDLFLREGHWWFRFSATVPGVEPAKLGQEVIGGRGDLVVTLVVREKLSLGRLAINPVDPQGQTITTYSARLFSPENNALVRRWEGAKGQPSTIKVPVGKYRLQVSPGKAPSCYRPFQREITIRPRELTKVRQPVETRGLLAITCKGFKGAASCLDLGIEVKPFGANDWGKEWDEGWLWQGGCWSPVKAFSLRPWESITDGKSYPEGFCRVRMNSLKYADFTGGLQIVPGRINYLEIVLRLR